MATQSIEEATGTGLIGSILGYAIGNGIAARSGNQCNPSSAKKTLTNAP
jgi:hypothetical protein